MPETDRKLRTATGNNRNRISLDRAKHVNSGRQTTGRNVGTAVTNPTENNENNRKTPNRKALMNKVTLLCVAAIGLMMTACNGNKIYNQYQHTPIAGWEKNDTLPFDIPPIATDGNYGMDLGLRINNAYPFMGLTLIIERTVYPGHTVTTDTLDCKLFDENGSVKGQGVSYYQFHYHVNDLPLHRGDSLHIAVRHDMKREILPGISDIGIELERK